MGQIGDFFNKHFLKVVLKHLKCEKTHVFACIWIQNTITFKIIPYQTIFPLLDQELYEKFCGLLDSSSSESGCSR